MGLHFLKGFWRLMDLGGRNAREELQLEQLLWSLSGSHWALCPGSLTAVSTLHVGCPPGTGIVSMFCTTKSPEGTVWQGQIQIFPVLLAWTRVVSLCLSNVLSGTLGCECPHEAGVGMENDKTYFPGV